MLFCCARLAATAAAGGGGELGETRGRWDVGGALNRAEGKRIQG